MILINNLQPNVTSVRISHRFGFQLGFQISLEFFTWVRISHRFGIFTWVLSHRFEISHGFGIFTWVWNFPNELGFFTSIRIFHIDSEFSHGFGNFTSVRISHRFEISHRFGFQFGFQMSSDFTLVLKFSGMGQTK